MPALTFVVVTLLASTVARASDGATLFAKYCAMCHQTGASGLPGQFPRLAGRVGRISRDLAGRNYLIDVVSYGMAGQITVDNDSIFGVMPPLQLSDDDAAGVLSYVASIGATTRAKITAAEVAAARARPPRNSAEVRAERQALQDAGILD